MTLADLTATELAGRLARRDVSAREVLADHLIRIEQTNGAVNALVTLTVERAQARAAELDEHVVHDGPVGPLHGLPIAHKDLQDTAGIRTTYGSPIYAHNVPRADTLLVTRIGASGAVLVGKTNTPEFGAGSQTFNPVFGATRNPWDLTKTAGGSSGGAAAALACRMIALADGSDMGGSLRNPASFCNVVGFRPSPGLVPSVPDTLSRLGLAVDGPMARTVDDVILLTSAIAGFDPRSPVAWPVVPSGEAPARLRVAIDPSPVGLAFDPGVVSVIDRDGRQLLADGGAAVIDRPLDLTAAEEPFRVLRAWYFAHALGGEYQRHRERLKPDIVWNIEQGLSLTGADIAVAEAARSRLTAKVAELFRDVDVIAVPVSQVPPFDVELAWPREINGQTCETYLDWMRSAYWVSLTGLPALAVPCGFTDDGLPVGMQLVGRPGGDLSLLAAAAQLPGLDRLTALRPPVCAGPSPN